MKKTILLLTVLFASVLVRAQLSGTYTIDAAQPATATNYQSVTAAVGDLAAGTRTDGGPVNGPG
ncbi:MAG: hypothetical protein ACRC3B_19765, partial [Bacteroidia bacterium]